MSVWPLSRFCLNSSFVLRCLVGILEFTVEALSRALCVFYSELR